MPQRDPEELEPEPDALDEHPDTPEADYLDQHDEVLPEYQRGPTIAPDVPEADALDQALEAGYDDEGEVDEVDDLE
jgi:hypothetical protein